MCRNDHLVASTDSAGTQSQLKSGSTRSDADAVSNPAVVREIRLKPLDILAQDERAPAEQPRELRAQLIFDRGVLALERAEGHAWPALGTSLPCRLNHRHRTRETLLPPQLNGGQVMARP